MNEFIVIADVNQHGNGASTARIIPNCGLGEASVRLALAQHVEVAAGAELGEDQWSPSATP
jgi:hypothetical protein